MKRNIFMGQIGYRPTWAEINLNNLAYNFFQVKKCLKPLTKIMVCVKADAYGHGLVAVSKKLEASGVDFLGVASIDEGISLREARIKSPILILGLVLKSDIAPLFAYQLTPTVCDFKLAIALDRKAKCLNLKKALHLKVDTGMGRIGVQQADALDLARRISKLGHVQLEGIFTHFAFADLNREFTLEQIGLFNQLIDRLTQEKIRIPLKHAANSMGVLGFRQSHFNMVRPGLVIYGLSFKKSLPIKIKPVLSLKSKVVYVKRVEKGSGISYGHTYITDKDTNIVTLPIGYGDGYPRNLSNKAGVLIGGERFTISGRICMDQIMVDTGNFKVKCGDEVVLIGRQKSAKITIEELAGLAQTIPYEIACGLGSRIPRVYID